MDASAKPLSRRGVRGVARPAPRPRLPSRWLLDQSGSLHLGRALHRPPSRPLPVEAYSSRGGDSALVTCSTRGQGSPDTWVRLPLAAPSGRGLTSEGSRAGLGASQRTAVPEPPALSLIKEMGANPRGLTQPACSQVAAAASSKGTVRAWRKDRGEEDSTATRAWPVRVIQPQSAPCSQSSLKLNWVPGGVPVDV